VCDPSPKTLTNFCFDAHTHYYQDEFMGPAVEFVIKAFKGLEIQDKVVTGNDPWKADSTLGVSTAAAKATKKFRA
jgi:hypothetical protein